MSDKNHKLAAIVFTDIVGYTKRMAENEQQTMQLLQKQREIVYPIVESYGGEVIKEIGDGLLIMFESAIEAVRCAIGIQTRLKDEELTIRAGIHIGDVIFKDKDVFGSAVNIAARIEPLAPPNGICISETVRNQVENKDDIITLSLGKKELKGVAMPVEIFQVYIEGVTIKQNQSIGFIFKDLWRRNVIQILLGYLAASWIIKQAVDAITLKYLLSPHLVNLTWVILLSFMPTIFMLAYFHGKRSAGKWNRIEAISFTLNILFSILLTVFLFKGKDLGATTETKIVENEEGEKIERVVYKNEFRKKIAVFFYENESKDTSLTWLQYAIPFVVDYDLSQQLFIQAHDASEYMIKFRDAGYNRGTGAPWMLLKEIAEFFDFDYFLTGSFHRQADQFKVMSAIYNTKSGKLVKEFEIVNQNIFSIIDEISLNIYDALELPPIFSEKTPDLPVSEIYSASEKAIEYFSKGNIEIFMHNDFDKATNFIEMAIEEDRSFAHAHLVLAEYYFNNNQPEKAKMSLDRVMEYDYKLPERQKFIAKFIYYIFQQEAEKAIAVLKMWTDLYPEDIEAHDLLATRYQYKNMFAEAIEEYRIILALDPDQAKYIRYIGDLYERMGNFDSAIYYHKYYSKFNPKDFKSYRNLGGLYLNMAEFDLAAENLDKALTLEPGNIDLALNRIVVDMRLGNFEGVETKFLQLLIKCTTINDSANVFSSLSDFCELTGQVEKSLQYHKQFIKCLGKFINPMNFLVYNVFNLDKYIRAGKADEAYRILKESETKFQPPVDKVISFGYLFYYIELDSAENAEKYVQEAKDLAIGFGEEILLANIYGAEGRISELKKDYQKALENYEKYLKSRPLEVIAHQYIARCYRNLGNIKMAEKELHIALKHKPYYPENNYEAALIYLEKGNQQMALDHLKRALEVWKFADPIYKPAYDAKMKLKELENI